MGKSAIESKIDFLSFLEKKLVYKTMSDMDFEQYKTFVITLFRKLDIVRNLAIEEGIKMKIKNQVIEFVKKHYGEVIDNSDDSDIIFERRFSAITEEILEFCSGSFFWDVEFNLYMNKWEKGFQADWFKNI